MIENIVFDFGGVLMDWDPRYYYKSYFNDDEKMEYFLSQIATNDWNAQQDKGRPLSEGTEILVEKHPDWEKEIRAYYDNWTKMLRSDIPKNVNVLRALEGTPYDLFGLTNWSHETFPYALANYDFFQLFDGKIVVSGEEKLIKPDPQIWEVLEGRYDLDRTKSVFIDDNGSNIAMATELGYIPVHIKEETDLKKELEALGVQFG